MFVKFEDLLDNAKPVQRQAVIQYEDTIDAIYKHIYHYLQDITKRDLSDEESSENLKHLYINNHLEGISDSLQQVAIITTKLEDTRTSLNKWETEGIIEFYKEVKDSYRLAMESFSEGDESKAIEVINRNPMILRMEKNLRFEHFNHGENESSRLSAVYVDVMNELLRVNHHSVNIAYTIIGMV
ncbi:MAG: hypothetical protein LRY73_10645 [Bacillus sp. (in: Bacteria)]|nr:hypothetical protein [Bacillus sp. (in: firmicutes)]